MTSGVVVSRPVADESNSGAAACILSEVTTLRTDSSGSDAHLVRAARAGDAASLGLLLHRHRASVYASAVTILGHGECAQDAVQDTFVVALRRLPELREPAAFAAWLQAIARTVCLMQLRRHGRELLVGEPPETAAEDEVVHAVEEELERHALREWLWSAIDALPEAQRLAVMLRYFGRERSYEEIARIAAVPIGTVRSRLNSARRALADRLLASAALPIAVGERTERWHSRLAEALDGLNRRDPFPAQALLAVDAVITAGKRVGGRRDIVRALLQDSEAGVRVSVSSVVAGAGIVVLDGEIENPEDDPAHCPPAFTWVGFHDEDRIARLHFHHPAPETAAGVAA